MTDDLVKRLREGNNWDWEMMNMGGEAADCIELLQAALKQIANWPDYRLPKPQEIARAALREKKDG